MNTATPQEGALRRLKNRSEFLGAARGQRVGRSAFSLQANARDLEQPGIGYTVTKQTGNSPQRNRIRRRLKEAARLLLAERELGGRALVGVDLVLIGRDGTRKRDFPALQRDIARALEKAGVT